MFVGGHMFNSGLKKEALSSLKKEKSLYDEQLTTTVNTLEGFHNNKLEIKDKVKKFHDEIKRIGGKPDDIEIELQQIETELNKFDGELKRLESEVDNQNFGTLTGAGVATGAGIAAFGPTAAMAIATTFGTASTGTAIATLSGAAATNAALAWLGGGAIAAGGSGIAGGSALIAATGPVGWAVGGTALAIGGFMANSKNKEIARKATEQIEKLKEEKNKLNELTTKVELHCKELNKQDGVFSYIVDNFRLKEKSHWTELTESEMKDVGAAANIAAVMTKILNEKVA